MNESDEINFGLGMIPIQNNNKDLLDIKESLLYLIKFDEDVQNAIKKFIL